MSRQSSNSASPAKPDFSAMKACPRYYRCNVPLCPLDPWQDTRPYFPGKPKCRLEKVERMRLAATIAPEQLPRRGMTKAEWGQTYRRQK